MGSLLDILLKNQYFITIPYIVFYLKFVYILFQLNILYLYYFRLKAEILINDIYCTQFITKSFYEIIF